jgi:hypothetical protein
VNDEGKRMRMEGVGLIFGTSYHFLEGLRKTTKNLSQNSRFTVQDSNLGPAKYKTGVLIT